MKPKSKDNQKPFQKFYKEEQKGETSFKRNEPKRGKRPNRRRFEEEDLSVSRKKKENQTPDKNAEPEVTFRKELKNKWALEAPKPPFFKTKKNEKPFKKQDRKHEHPPKKRGFNQYFGTEEERPSKVYDAKGSKKKSGQAHLKRKEINSELSTEPMPLNKYIAHCDICSRRDAAILVRQGKVKVNGELVTEPGYKVTGKDKVSLAGKLLQLQEHLVYILLNKPKGFITTTDDPKKRRTVMDFFKGHIEERIYPVGRLDRDTTGLLLLTNDGDLAQKLAHPSHEIKKIYQVTLEKPLSETDFDCIKAGVTLEDGLAPVDQLAYLDSKEKIGLEIHNGRNRIVRRIFQSLGYEVKRLDRVMYAGLTKKDVPRGQWRFLSKQEVINLKHLGKS